MPLILLLLFAFATLFVTARIILDTDFGVPLWKMDFAQYWASSYILHRGGDPYDLALMREIQREQLLSPDPSFLWTPPTIFLWSSFLGFFSPAVALAGWILLGASAALVGLYLFVRICLNRRPSIYLLPIVALHYPLLLGIWSGQVVQLLLAAWCVLLVASARSFRGSDYLLGAAIAVLLIKPHLFWLPAILIGMDVLKCRRWGVGIGFFCMLSISLLPALLLNPEVVPQYLSAASSPPIHWKTPTLGSWLQEVTQIHTPLIRMLPTVVFGALALLAEIVTWRTRRPLTERLLIAIPFSLLAAPYGWTYDQQLLLPTILWMVSLLPTPRAVLRGVAAAVILNCAHIVIGAGQGMELQIWYPMVVLVLAVLAKRRLMT